MPIIELPNGQSAEFPDSMSKDQIKSVIQKKFPPQRNNISPQNSKIEQIMRETGGNRTPLDTLRDVSAGAISGISKGIQGAASPTDIVLPNGRSPQINIDSLAEPISSPNKSIGGEFSRGVGEYLPYGLAGGPSFLGQLAAGGAFGAATTKPEEQNLFGLLPEGKSGGAIKNALLNAITHGGFQFFNAMRPSNLFRGNLSPKELQANVNAAEGTTTGLGDVIGSPFLKRQHENVLSKIPFSGANQKFQQAGKEVEQRGQNILSGLLGKNNPDTINDELSNTLVKQYKIHQKDKESFYKDSDKIANDIGLELDLPNFSKTAKKFNAALKDTNILKYEPEMASLMNKLKNYETPVKKIESQILQEKGKPFVNSKYPKLQEANLLKGKLNQLAEQYKHSTIMTDRQMAGIFSQLSKSLKNDIQSGIKKSGNKNLEAAYNKAEKNYAENYSPFLDKEVYKFISGKADSDTLTQNFLKVSQGADRNKALSKLTSKLSDKEKELLAYSYFSRAVDKEGNLNPAKLSTLINKLGKNQFKTLVPNANMRNQLMNYNRLYKMNTKSVNMMQNPATGQQNLDIIPALLGHAGTVITGGALGGVPGALAGLIAPGLISRPLVNALTNPNTRKSLVNAMIKNKKWNKNAITGLQTGARGLEQNR